jgi:hypothetical protein
VATDEVTFVVGPVIHLALLWHQHQPLYRDLTALPIGGYRFPWVGCTPCAITSGWRISSPSIPGCI